MKLRIKYSDEGTYYKTVLQSLKDRQLYLQTANINKEESKIYCNLFTIKIFKLHEAAGRISRVLDEICLNI